MSEAAVETTEETTTPTPADETAAATETSVLGNDESTDEKSGDSDTVLGDAEAKAEEKTEQAPDWKPEDLQMPENLPVLLDGWDEKISGSVLTKLSKEDAEEALSLVAEWDQQRTAMLVDHLNEQSQGWRESLESSAYVVDRGIEGMTQVAAEANAFINEFVDTASESGAQLLREFNTSGIGNHPDLVIAFSKAARALDLVSSDMGGGGGTPNTTSKKSLASKIWGEKSFPDQGQ